MRPSQYSTAALSDLFRRQTVASLPEVMAALGTRARRTAFRKLKELPYRTSYSHRGGYYTLEELISFDQHGLWSFRAVRFSAAGTLLATAAALVSDAPAGQFSEELDNLLHVGTQDVLRKLVQERKLSRQRLAGQFLYCAADRTRRAQQLSARRALLAAPGLLGPVPDADFMPDELRAAIVLFASLLDERQRRLYAGLESLKCGWGGDARIAGLLDIQVCPRTVARILKDLDYRLRVNHKRISATLHTRLVDPYHLTVTVCHYPAAPRPSSVDLEHRLGDEGTRANGARSCYGRSRRLPQQGRCCSTRTNSSTVMNKMVAFS